jgi:crossover junction endodeoxyribonuclease RuvC
MEARVNLNAQPSSLKAASADGDSNGQGHLNSNLYLGIDPGLNRTGYALLERSANGPILREGGVISSNAKLSLAERVCEIGQGLKEVLEEFKPQVMAIEQVFTTPKFPKPALMMAHARGVILYEARLQGVLVTHYTPTQIKKLLTGSGRAGKEQIQHAVKNELKLKQLLEPNDVADATAVAMCHYHSVKII